MNVPHRLALLGTVVASQVANPAMAAQSFTDTGFTPAAITDTVDAYRAALGPINPNNGSSFQTGRREINWDGVPENRSDPNLFPGDFFNAATGGRARGIVFSTMATGFMTSANIKNDSGTPPLFGYPSDFQTFSPERLFAVIGDYVMDVTFARAGKPEEAGRGLVRGFGAVFTDVESATSSVYTRLDYYDADGNLVGSVDAPAGGSQSLSFAGMVFDSPIVARVRITLGDGIMNIDKQYISGSDGVAMDDFIYSEPVPEPGTWALMAAGLGLLGAGKLRRRG